MGVKRKHLTPLEEGWGCRREETVCTWLGESAESREASELTEEDGEVGSTLVWISVGGRRHGSWLSGAGETLRGRENLLLLQRTIPRVHVVADNCQ